MFNDFNGLKDVFFDSLITFGGKKGKYVERQNVGLIGQFPDNGAWFGCIAEGEEERGAYSDLSIAIFPSNEDTSNDDRWIVSLIVGSSGYMNDYDLASLPGTRRLFVRHLPNGSYVKSDFLDIELHSGITSYLKGKYPPSLKKTIEKYRKYILACTIIDPNNVDIENESFVAENVLKLYAALYAHLREWDDKDKSNQNVRDAVAKVLRKSAVANSEKEDGSKELEEADVISLLEKRKYVVLQGAPGTGKTRLAKKIVGSNKVFFTQFHAETSYSDFVYGILPSVNSENLSYSTLEGVFVKAIKYAIEHKEETVYLIIDEINRANLSNVLGPSFYLFEPFMEENKDIQIEVCPGLSLSKLPENLYVIATMNTADRSLAVVDFALRRRFAWYNMYPHEVKPDGGLVFRAVEFNDIAWIFEKYATDDELNLQPGQAYFIVSGTTVEEQDANMKLRMRYEIMPLIKEYLENGMLTRAKDEFINYFRNIIGEELYR